ncbi:Uncharacterised protein [Pandoraea pulmonicola]|uniref:Uncharacterized protein n=1 Tax=Pandoraea pulmonicola TaxID=93221 RepID=A0AAJ4Z9W9_PANPU|nr:Uncharacterised protein [Pandoraea pulmonicola]
MMIVASIRREASPAGRPHAHRMRARATNPVRLSTCAPATTVRAIS